MTKTANKLTAITALAMLAGTADAAVVFVDATTENTVEASNTANDYTATSWNFRSGFGSSLGDAGILESYGGSGDPELKTTISGLNAGLYDVYVFYMTLPDNEDNDWPIRAGLSSDPDANTLYDESNGTNAAGLTFAPGSDPVATNQNTGQTHYYAVIGQVSVGDGGSIDIFVDDLPATSSLSRTWYDGVGYELVPEPNSLALLGLGGLLLARRRRNA